MKSTANHIKWIFSFLLNIILLSQVHAQGDSLDFLRSTGKIYTVVAVIVIIFIGIVMYLYRIDNKLTKLENQFKNEQ
ncbi:MAG TPA: CcmD family protein [Saprospiraceae bacterium]|nr:CcmD family protein [Saprospiraceae bacterium]HRO07591.1 CcmD family protein [Saprospiraceae bacterium]HRO73201.1 CcmD family protein [Saprospiraceae bacterium]HRP40874.1 CcmD family protein [Saprospiraceae bacterium]